MRNLTLALLALLAACGGRAASDYSAQAPGVNVATAALQGGSPQMALDVASRILAAEPRNEAALVVQGDALTSLGRFDEARASYAAALERNPGSVGAKIGLGRLQLGRDPAAAEALFMEALQGDARNTIALNDLGIARDLQGRHADAQAAYREALGINPDHSATSVNLALSLAMAGSARDGVRILRPLASTPNASRKLRHDLAAVLTMAGDRDEAARIMSSDLSAEDVRRALDDYAAARSGAPTASLPGPAPNMAAAQTVKASGDVSVQLVTAPSEDAAQNEWRRLQERMPTLLGSRVPSFFRTERDGHTYWRVRTGGFADNQVAEAFCREVRDAGGPCVLGGG